MASTMSARIQRRLLDLGYRRADGKPDVMRFCLERGYLPQYVYAWLKGTTPSEPNLRRLAGDLGVEPAWLHYGAGDTGAVRERQAPYRAESLERGGGVAGRRQLEQRLRELEEQGVISHPTKPRRDWRPLAHRPGALKRFLESRE